MKLKKVWKGEYKGINYEIQNFKLCDKDAWTFYLYIALDSIPENLRERFWLRPKKLKLSNARWHYDYYKEGLISGIDFHGGITWYSKESQEREPRVIKIGCDYQHLWDDGHFYSENSIECDAKKAIDSFIELVPNLMKRCTWDGHYVPEEQGEYHGDLFYAKEGWAANEKSCQEWKTKLEAIK